MFTRHFNSRVFDGDTIECKVDGFDCVARLERDTDSGPPDKMWDGYWPSLDPKSAGYIGNKSQRTLARWQAAAQDVLDKWNNDEWHYYGVVVNVSKNGIQLTTDYHHACWGIEGNFPSKRKGNPNKYFRDVANNNLIDALSEAKAKLAKLKEDA